MGLTNLEGLFKPNAVAVAGASDEPRTIGNIIMRHLLAGRFLGPVMPLTPDEDEVMGLTAYPTVDTLPVTPDLAVLCVPPEMACRYIEDLGRRGAKAVVALCPGYAKMRPDIKLGVQRRMLAQARKHGVRMLGPSGLGLIIPSIGLNASLVPADPPKGKIAFVSQSASLFTAVLDWAKDNAVGFSQVVSLGDRVDLEYHDILDYLASDHSLSLTATSRCCRASPGSQDSELMDLDRARMGLVMERLTSQMTKAATPRPQPTMSSSMS